jgi:hypothetical protein
MEGGMMNEHRMKVLEMLSAGKISVEEAERLIERLDGSPAPDEEGAPSLAEALATPAAERRPPKRPKFLRVCVLSEDGDKVNVRVPLALVRAGIKMKALLPQHAREAMEQQGIDLSAVSGENIEELVEAIAELSVDVDSEKGDKVRVFCE